MKQLAKTYAWLTLACFGLVSGPVVCAEESPPSEYQLKAAFLFNFVKFVEWPSAASANPKSPIVIGILGENPFGSDLARTIRGKTVNNRPLEVKEFHSVIETTNCHVLFISASAKKQLPDIFNGLGGVCVLTVGETDGFTQTGGMVNFVLEGNKIRFEIRDDAAKKAGLKISSKLLSLALRPAR